jgi:hypothetical protein
MSIRYNQVITDLGYAVEAGVVLSSRPPYGTRAFLPTDPHTQDSLTGPPIAIAGTVPVISHAGCATPAGLALLERAGLPVCKDVRTYKGQEEYLSLLAGAAADGERLALQHRHPEGDVDTGLYWTNPDLLSLLNNKGNLALLVDSEYVPERFLIPSNEAEEWLIRNPGPWVIKAATDWSTGGGYDVLFQGEGEPIPVEEVRRFTASCDVLVVERMLNLVTNWCFHFSIDSADMSSLVGVTEQVVSRRGTFHGGWLGNGVPTPPSDLIDACQRVVERAAARGFRGFCGIDAAITSTGNVKIYDLNFRLNGTTPALLALSRRAASSDTSMCGLYRSWSFPGALPQAIEAITRSAGQTDFLPIATYDPNCVARTNLPSTVYGVVLGENRREVNAVLARLRDARLT